jgi:hypothetical protein
VCSSLRYGKQIKVTDKKFATYKEERTLEGKSINNSLTSLGNCVKAVAKISGILIFPSPSPLVFFCALILLLACSLSLCLLA